jgi:hypothetical protein
MSGPMIERNVINKAATTATKDSPTINFVVEPQLGEAEDLSFIVFLDQYRLERMICLGKASPLTGEAEDLSFIVFLDQYRLERMICLGKASPLTGEAEDLSFIVFLDQY